MVAFRIDFFVVALLVLLFVRLPLTGIRIIEEKLLRKIGFRLCVAAAQQKG